MYDIHFHSLFSGISKIIKVRVQKVLIDARWNFYDICQMAMFAGIPASELTRIPAEYIQAFRNPVYSQVAQELHIDYETVRCVAEAVLKHYETRERVRRRKRSTVWEKLDEEMLPKVREGVTEELKMQDQMAWVGKMNNIRACAEEIVEKEIVYA